MLALALWGEPLIRHTDAIQPLPIAIGLSALVLGAMVYLTDRLPDSAWLVHTLIGHRNADGHLTSLFGTLGGNLPDFLHAFAFSMITAGVWGKTPANPALPCLLWFAINSLFELGQAYPEAVNRVIPEGFRHIPLLGRIMIFFTAGTFDTLDILAFAAGSVVAFALLTMMEKKE